MTHLRPRLGHLDGAAHGHVGSLRLRERETEEEAGSGRERDEEAGYGREEARYGRGKRRRAMGEKHAVFRLLVQGAGCEVWGVGFK